MSIYQNIKRWVRDGWENSLTKLGTTFDKSRWFLPYSSGFLNTTTLDALYDGDAIAKKIVNELPEFAFKQGFSLTYAGDEDADYKIRIENLANQMMKKLSLRSTVLDAITWGRLYGRGAILLGVNDGQSMSSPLQTDQITEIYYLEDIDRTDFTPESWDSNPFSSTYGDPLTWRIYRTSGDGQVQSIIVHSSRLILTGGARISRSNKVSNEFSDASVLDAIYTPLQIYNSNWASIANMMVDASQGVLKIDGFLDLLGDNSKDLFAERMAIIDQGRSVARVLPIDADKEDFSYIERSFSGIKDILEKSELRLSGSSSMPSTVLFGRSPAGMNATGESDIRLWYDAVISEQLNVYSPLLEPIIQIIVRLCGASDPEKWGILWPSLWQLSPKEEAEHRKMVAETDKIYVDMKVLKPETVAMTRFGGEVYSDDAPQLSQEDFEEEKTRITDEINEVLAKAEECGPDPASAAEFGKECFALVLASCIRMSSKSKKERE